MCFLIDLFDGKDDRADSVDRALLRQYQLIFANRCQREIEARQQNCELRNLISRLGTFLPREVRRSGEVARILKQGSDRAINLLHLAYRPSANESPLMMFDFSRASLIERWQAGAADMARALEIGAEIAGEIRRPGLTVRKVRSLG